MTRNESLCLEAKKRCKLDDEDIKLVKQLNINPLSLIKNIPSKSEPWKAPVKVWRHEIDEKQKKKPRKNLSEIKKPILNVKITYQSRAFRQ